MNSRERILAAIRHQDPGGVPVDLSATASTGISAIAYTKLKDYLGIQTHPTRVFDVIQQLALVDDEILDRYHVDVVSIGRAFNTQDTDWHDFTLPQGIPVQFPAWFKPVSQPDGSLKAFNAEGFPIGIMPEGATFFDQTCFPYLNGYPDNYTDLAHQMGKVHWAGLPLSPWDHVNEPDFWAQLRQHTLAMRQSSDRAFLIGAGCNLFEWGTFLRRMDYFLMDLVADPDNVERLLDALVEKHLQTLEKICQAVGDIVDIVTFGDDLGTNSGPFMSPKTYRKLFLPRHKIMVDYVKNHSQMHPYLHSCGSIYRLLPDLIEAGFEIINPVQTNTKDMQPDRLKREFGKDLTFWGGGSDTRHILNRGTPAQVKDDVRRNIEILAPGGGFVFNTIHNIMPDVPPENVEAMFEAIDEYR